VSVPCESDELRFGSKMPATKTAAKKKRYSFSAKIEQRPGRWFTVLVPAALSRTLGIRGSIPIVGVMNGKAKFRSSLLPRATGLHFLAVRAELRQSVGASAGDRVTIRFQIDREPRTVPTPEDLRELLEAEGLVDGYELIPPGRKMQFLKYLEQAVHETTRQKRLAAFIELAYAAREKQADRMLRRGEKNST